MTIYKHAHNVWGRTIVDGVQNKPQYVHATYHFIIVYILFSFISTKTEINSKYINSSNSNKETVKFVNIEG